MSGKKEHRLQHVNTTQKTITTANSSIEKHPGIENVAANQPLDQLQTVNYETHIVPTAPAEMRQHALPHTMHQLIPTSVPANTPQVDFYPAQMEGVVFQPRSNPQGPPHHPERLPQQPAFQQAPFPAQRQRVSSMQSQYEWHDSGKDQWPQHAYRNRNTGVISQPINRNGVQPGGHRNFRGNRRGSYSHRNATAPIPQQPVDSVLPHQRRGPGPPENIPWRTNNSTSRQRACPNASSIGGVEEYIPCTCEQCDARNRSVLVKVRCAPDAPAMDVRSRLRYGLGDRYGAVEAVFPIACREGQSFLVR